MGGAMDEVAPIRLRWQVGPVGACWCMVGLHGMVNTVGVGTLVSTDGCCVEQFCDYGGITTMVVKYSVMHRLPHNGGERREWGLRIDGSGCGADEALEQGYARSWMPMNGVLGCGSPKNSLRQHWWQWQ